VAGCDLLIDCLVGMLVGMLVGWQVGWQVGWCGFSTRWRERVTAQTPVFWLLIAAVLVHTPHFIVLECVC
jgi:NhaP-type Na+/H+ or K+/H+ antiporter